MYAPKAGRRYSRTLTAADGSTLADSIESYLGNLSVEEARDVVRRYSSALPYAERTQLELYVRPAQLENGDTLIARRFIAFLRSHPHAAEYLDEGALEPTALPLEPLSRPERRRPNWSAVGLGVLAFLVAVTPLAAQYAHQRGVLSGLIDSPPAPIVPAARAQEAAIVPQLHRVLPAKPALHPHPAARTQRANFAARQHQLPLKHRIVARPHRAHHRFASPPRIASMWKFDRRNYRYFSPEARTLSQRARLEVQSYLNAVIAGNTRSALQHLGLPPDANLVNLSEVPIISHGARARVVWVKPQPNGQTQVDADIRGRKGEYFEVFYVAADGPAVRITDRYYIPVSKQYR